MTKIVLDCMEQSIKSAKSFGKGIKIIYLNKITFVHPDPIIIFGNQKSGTTVIASLLAKAAGKTFIIDPFVRIKDQLNSRHKIFQNKLAFSDFIEKNSYYFSFDIIKEPNFSFLYKEAKNYYKKSKFVFIVRDPRHNIRSILNRLKIPGNLKEIDSAYHNNMPEGWQVVVQGRLPYIGGKNYIERLAYRWNKAADAYVGNSNQINLIRYEDFLIDKESVIKNLSQKLGLTAKYDISDLLNVQYQPRGNRDVSLPDFFGEENLAAINQICQERMAYFNYYVE